MSKDRARIIIVLLILAGGLFLKPSGVFAQERIKEKSWFQKFIQRVPPRIPSDSVRIFILGDVMLHSKQMGRDYTPFLEELKPLMKKADATVVNMEFPLGGKPYTGYPVFSAPDDYADYIKDIGADIFLVANNHIMDRGTEGLEKTLRKYAGMEGIKFTGAYSKDVADSLVNPLIINLKGAKIAFLNFTYGMNTGLPEPASGAGIRLMKKEDTKELFRRARKAGADIIIALPHWGVEYDLIHSKSQENYAKWLAEEGADVIIGSHPHVVQDTCNIVTSDGRKVPVAYSLGNAVSNMSAINTRLELAATVTLVRNFLGQVHLAGFKLDFLWCTLPEMLTDNYRTIIVEDRIGQRDKWLNASDYDNMISTLKRVKEKTGIGK